MKTMKTDNIGTSLFLIGKLFLDLFYLMQDVYIFLQEKLETA